MIKAFYQRYERVLIPGLLIAGVLADIVTFRRLQAHITFTILGVYAAIAGAAILYSHLLAGKEHPFIRRLHTVAPFVIQFTFGALLSMSLLFYWFSGAFSVSWPILAAVALLMASNEVFRHVLFRPLVQISVYTFILFSYFSILFPFLFNSLLPQIFFLGGLASLLLTLFLIAILVRFAPTLRGERLRLIACTLTVFSAMNGLYLLNVIPPIPLSLREAGIYRDVHQAGNDYVLTGEPQSFLGRLLPGETIHPKLTDRVYAFTAIYAPTDLNTVIYHRWEFYDSALHAWTTRDRLSYVISGGRDEGYRGYSFKTHLVSGQWRVTVETARGQVLGRIPFTVVTP